MNIRMPHIPEIFKRAGFLKNGRALIGIVFLLSGAIICFDGAVRLRELWTLLAPYFPLNLPQHAAGRLQEFLPLIFATFVSAVGSVAAVLIGGLWLLSGLGDVFHREKSPPEQSDLAHPELVAESLRCAEAQYWKSSSLLVRLLVRIVPTARFTSPVSYRMAAGLFGSAVKIFVLAIVIGLFFRLFHLIPGLVQKYLQASISLTVPSPRPLYFILGFLMIFDGLMALSLVARKRREFVRGRESFSVHGQGDPHLFLALVEEGCKLLSAKGLADKRPVRLRHADNPHLRGSLIECFSEQIGFFARPAAYCCLPVIFFFLTTGFSRLVYFRRVPEPMSYIQFLSSHSLDWILEVAFALALILAGVYLADRAARLFRIQRFQSALVFCQVGVGNPPRVGPPTGRRFSFSADSESQAWSVVNGVDPEFAEWAKNPHAPKRFQCEIFWTQAVSEASLDEDEGRFIIAMQASAGLDDGVRRIAILPFHVDFESGTRETPSTGT